MVKIENIKTPKTIEEFRFNLKSYCLGYNDRIFIYNRINRKQYKIEVNKLSKISDVFEFIRDDFTKDFAVRHFNIVLMCDLSNINMKDIIMNKEEAIKLFREVYFFNNQSSEERSHFLNSTPYAVKKIVSGKKIFSETDYNPKQTAMNLDILSGLYFHLFGKYFDTVSAAKIKYNLSKYN